MYAPRDAAGRLAGPRIRCRVLRRLGEVQVKSGRWGGGGRRCCGQQSTTARRWGSRSRAVHNNGRCCRLQVCCRGELQLGEAGLRQDGMTGWRTVCRSDLGKKQLPFAVCQKNKRALEQTPKPETRKLPQDRRDHGKGQGAILVGRRQEQHKLKGGNSRPGNAVRTRNHSQQKT